MKKVYMAVMLCISGCAFAQTGVRYRIELKVGEEMTRIEKAELKYALPMSDKINEIFSDTGRISGTGFVFEGMVPEPLDAYILVRFRDARSKTGIRVIRYPFELENSQILIEFQSTKHPVISGSHVQDEQQRYVNMMMQAEPGTRSKAGYEHVVARSFIRQYPSSPFSFILLRRMLYSAKDTMDYISLYNSLPEAYKRLPSGIMMAERISQLQRLRVGAAAPEIEQPGIDGQLVKLSDYRGKYVLLQFWASWCNASRKQNPNLANAYRKLMGKRFEIIAISLDTEKESWLAAIGKDSLHWIHAGDLKGFEGGNTAAKSYFVRSVPSNFLIDPNGIIVAKEIRGINVYEQLSVHIP